MRISRKVIKFTFIVLFAVVVIIGIYIKSSNILNIVEKIYSPDKDTKLIVYVFNKNSLSNKEESFDIKIYDNNGSNNKAYIFYGRYGGIFWTSDSSKYVIKVKEYKNNIYVVDENRGDITGIDKSLDIILQTQINDNPDIFNFAIDKELSADYEFIRWEKNNRSMLIYYELNDIDRRVHSGYFLYDYESNKINDMLTSTK